MTTSNHRRKTLLGLGIDPLSNITEIKNVTTDIQRRLGSDIKKRVLAKDQARLLFKWKLCYYNLWMACKVQKLFDVVQK